MKNATEHASSTRNANSFKSLSALALAVIGVFCGAFPAWATPMLGTAQEFAVLGATPSVTNTGTTTIWGDVGISPASSITGKSSMTVNGVSALSSTDVHEGDAVASQAQSDALAAYTTLAALGYPVSNDLTGVDLGGLTLAPGVYHFDTTAALNGVLTLDFSTNPGGDYVFEVGTALTTGSGSSVSVIGGNSLSALSGVYWLMGVSGGAGTGAATLGSSSELVGNILALDTISFGSTASILCGRAISLNAAVTMISNTISNDCTADTITTDNDYGSVGFSGGKSNGGGGGGTVPEPATLALLGLGLAGLGLSRRRQG